MQQPAIVPVILCGGHGTRLWPRSRDAIPQPFLPLIGRETLFQQTLMRCQGNGFGDPVIVSGAAHAELVEKQLNGIAVGEIIVEPAPRGTAAAVGVAAARLEPEAVMLVCPSDHHMADNGAFAAAAAAAASLAKRGELVCLGVPASAPETRFGYIRRGDPLVPHGFRVEEFVEKPSKAVAEEFVKSGQFAWNAGIFAFRAGDYLAELHRWRPSMAQSVREAVEGGERRGLRFYPRQSSFEPIEAESLDYAVMEQSNRVALVMLEAEWSDVGTWQALHRTLPKDSAGNAVRGPAELIGCRNLLVDSDGPTVHVLGLEDIVIVVDGDDILVASTTSAADVTQLARRSRP
jgi:mannose-1-phosphate guanylyltransferase